MAPHEKRAMLLGAVLDISSGQYVDKIKDPTFDLKTVPGHLDERIGTMVQCLTTQAAIQDAEAGQVYLQQLALMTTADLHYVVRTFGTDPFNGEPDPVLVAAQKAFALAEGDSNDDEITALREALENALAALGIDVPEDPDSDG